MLIFTVQSDSDKLNGQMCPINACLSSLFTLQHICQAGGYMEHMSALTLNIIMCNIIPIEANALHLYCTYSPNLTQGGAMFAPNKNLKRHYKLH